MAWHTGITYGSTDPVDTAFTNGVGNDFRAWGDNVDANGKGLANLASITGASGALAISSTDVTIAQRLAVGLMSNFLVKPTSGDGLFQMQDSVPTTTSQIRLSTTLFKISNNAAPI